MNLTHEETLTNRQASNPNTQSVIGHGECHVAPMSSLKFEDHAKEEQSIAIDS